MITQTIEGILEIDGDRGVIYFHASPGQNLAPTPLRICSLPKPIPLVTETTSLDVTLGYGANWSTKSNQIQVQQKLKRLTRDVGVEMICFVRYTDNRHNGGKSKGDYLEMTKSFPSSLQRALWVDAWAPYITILEEWSE